MNRRTVALIAAALVFSLVLASCDAMFEKNLFAGMVQKDLTASSVSSMSPSDVASLTDSKASMDQLAGDSAAKAAALKVLSDAYTADPTSATGQEAAIASATISIQTVAVAATFSASAVALAPSLVKSGGTTNLADSLKSILPTDVASAADAKETTPPADFAAIVNAYVEAYTALSVLGSGVSSSGVYASADIDSGEKLSAAVNALIGYEITQVSPAATGDALVSRLWGAITGNEAGVSFPDPTALADGTPIMNLAAGAGLSL